MKLRLLCTRKSKEAFYLLRRSHSNVAEAADGQHSDSTTGIRYSLHHVVHQDINQHQLRHHVMV